MSQTFEAAFRRSARIPGAFRHRASTGSTMSWLRSASAGRPTLAVSLTNLDFTFVSFRMRKGHLRCVSGVRITPDVIIEEADGADIVVVPGMSVSASEPLGESLSTMCGWLRYTHNSGARIASACTGALVLAEAGLLDDLEATTHWAFRDLFRLCYPRVRPVRKKAFVARMRVPISLPRVEPLPGRNWHSS